jgi:methyl-accepting chemotaxis protein
MTRLAEGEQSIEISGTARRDELGAMARAVAVFKETAIEAERLAAERSEENGKRIKRTEMLETNVQGFESAAGRILAALREAASGLDDTAQKMTHSVAMTREQTSSASSTSEQASSNVQTVAGAAEELSASIVEVSEQVKRSADTARLSADQAAKTNQTIQLLDTCAQKIGGVINLISAIASQTNLLALNATIEAARAGHSGRGFAIVASEVKQLAAQTAAATAEIKDQITEMQRVTSDAVAAIGTISGSVAQMDEISSAITAAVEQQRSATGEIARSAGEAAAGTREVSRNIQAVGEFGAATGLATETMVKAARIFSEEAQKLGGVVDEFMSAVRVA